MFWGYVCMRASSVLKLTGLLIPFLVCGNSNAQELTTPLGIGQGRPIEGSTGKLSLPNQSQMSIQSDLNPAIKVHKDPSGNRCVTVGAYSLPKIDFRKIFSGGHSEQGDKAPKMFEHMITAQNRCSQTIKLKVCYYASQNCITVDVPSHSDQLGSLGVASEMPNFRYQYTEQF